MGKQKSQNQGEVIVRKTQSACPRFEEGEGAMNLGMRVASGGWKRQENSLSRRASGKE